MYPKFIIAINKSHQYEEVGDRSCGVHTAKRKWLQGLLLLNSISVAAKGEEA